jgi:hypothetical protein
MIVPEDVAPIEEPLEIPAWWLAREASMMPGPGAKLLAEAIYALAREVRAARKEIGARLEEAIGQLDGIRGGVADLGDEPDDGR